MDRHTKRISIYLYKNSAVCLRKQFNIDRIWILNYVFLSRNDKFQYHSRTEESQSQSRFVRIPTITVRGGGGGGCACFEAGKENN